MVINKIELSLQFLKEIPKSIDKLNNTLKDVLQKLNDINYNITENTEGLDIIRKSIEFKDHLSINLIKKTECECPKDKFVID